MSVSTIQPLTIDYNRIRNNMLDWLTEESPRIPQPECTMQSTIRLKPHQCALLYRCLQIEHHPITITNIPEYVNTQSSAITNNKIIHTKYGVIADIVGAGKSYVILSIIAYGNNASPLQHPTTSLDENTFSVVSPLAFERSSNATLILVPSHLIKQWQNYINLYLPARFNVCILSTRRHLEVFHNTPEAWDTYDVVVMTFNMYKTYVEKMCSDYSKIYVNRVFVDEADTLVPAPIVRSNFYWAVTANVDNLMRINGCTHNSFIKRHFARINVYTPYTFVIYAQCSVPFVHASFQLPDIIVRNIESATPRFLRALTGIAQNRLLECLNANDTTGALAMLGVDVATQKQTEATIIHMFIHNLETSLRQCKSRIAFVEQQPEEDMHIYQQEYHRATENASKLETKIKNIKERILDDNMCKICYTDIETKTLLKCCGNAYCFSCINRWFMQKHSCPMCNSRVNVSTDMYIVDNNNQKTPLQSEQDEDNESIGPKYNKAQNLIRILNQLDVKNSASVIIFSSFLNTDQQDVIKYLDRHNITHSGVKGNLHTVNRIISDYKSGRIRVLFANDDKYASGLNLENTSDIILMHRVKKDIEDQIIGRAQRIGRESALRVWNLLYAHEM